MDENTTAQRKDPLAEPPGSQAGQPLSATPSHMTPTLPSKAEDERTDGAAPDQEAGSGRGGARGLLSDGLRSLKRLRSAKRAHASAREDAERIQRQIAEMEEELEHRRDITANYSQIVQREAERIAEAQTRAQRAREAREQAAQRVEALTSQMKAAHEVDSEREERLKLALSATESRETTSRENAKRIQRRLEEAKAALEKARKDKPGLIATATAAVEAAQTRLDTLRAEFADLQKNPSANSANYSVRSNELQIEISDAANDLHDAQEKLPRITQEVEDAISSACAQVREAEAPVEEAKREHEAITAEADEARDALDRAKTEAAARQKELRDQIAAAQKDVRDNDRTIEESSERVEDARAIVEEANDIRDHPEAIELLARQLVHNRQELERAQGDVAELAEEESRVRALTRASRMRFGLAVLLAAALVVALGAAWTLLR